MTFAEFLAAFSGWRQANGMEKAKPMSATDYDVINELNPVPLSMELH